MIAVLAAHTDDPVFSICSFLQPGMTVISTNAGIPGDEKGQIKHTVLRNEHKQVMNKMSLEHIEWDFLDDVYPFDEEHQFRIDIIDVLENYDEIWCPLGIHHPDHSRVSNLVMNNIRRAKKVCFYEELPYRQIYRMKYDQRIAEMRAAYGKTGLNTVTHDDCPHKEELVRMYKSQVDDKLVKTLLSPERIWSA